MKILTVVNPENDTQITCYAAKCSNDMLQDVETAFEELDIVVDSDIVKEIVYHLSHGYNYWYNELLCFEVVNVFEF